MYLEEKNSLFSTFLSQEDVNDHKWKLDIELFIQIYPMVFYLKKKKKTQKSEEEEDNEEEEQEEKEKKAWKQCILLSL